jgi:hypothetical protein
MTGGIAPRARSHAIIQMKVAIEERREAAVNAS